MDTFRPTTIDLTASVRHAELRPTVELVVTPGTRVADLLGRSELADLIAKLGPRGCEQCVSGRDIIIRERFDDVINVQFQGRG